MGEALEFNEQVERERKGCPLADNCRRYIGIACPCYYRVLKQSPPIETEKSDGL